MIPLSNVLKKEEKDSIFFSIEVYFYTVLEAGSSLSWLYQ